MSQNALLQATPDLLVNWIFGVSRVERISAARLLRNRNADAALTDCKPGDVIIRFNDGDLVRIPKEDGADELFRYLQGHSDTIARKDERVPEPGARRETRDFSDRLSG